MNNEERIALYNQASELSMDLADEITKQFDVFLDKNGVTDVSVLAIKMSLECALVAFKMSFSEDKEFNHIFDAIDAQLDDE